ncbi:hypothetical protein C1645_812862 [Glomus cerebriforme]|uniref:Uncharacterized protein n=1 Tax=Glomus cerebriforme TaxID=658196 RepID=A0A397TJA9_9GLOM|nr:hypothetical protein C1645_812862 [Glomus cerebriforme]
MFIDQLTSLNGEFLLPWSSITSRIFTQHNVTSITPIWFKTLQNIVLFNPSSGSLQLKSQFIFRSNNFKVSEGLYRLPSPLFEYQQQIIHHMNFSRQIMPYYFKQQKFWHFEDNLIKRYIEKGSLQNQLLHYQNIFESSTNLEFYTDGSLIDPAMNTMSMGFALIQSSSAAPYIEFAARIERWPSSYRAELAAILVALIISPMNSTITIFTDSKSSIDHFFYLQQQQLPLIKGFVPQFLTNTINDYTKNINITRSIISIFLDRIYTDINHLIWKPRCDQQILDEINAGIDKKSKYKKKQHNGAGVVDLIH